MKYILTEEFQSPQVQDTNAVLKEYLRLKEMEKEIKLRMGVIYRDLQGRFSHYQDSDFKVEFKSVPSTRLDTGLIRDYIKEKNLDIKRFEKTIESTRLDIKRRAP